MGKGVGKWWRTAVTPQIYPLRVDLSAVIFIDPEGKELLEKCTGKAPNW